MSPGKLARPTMLACLVALLAGGCSPKQASPPAAPAHDAAAPLVPDAPPAPPPPPPPVPAAPVAVQPRQGNDFVGSSTCLQCHKKQFGRWQKDWHARALNPAAPAVVVGRFDQAHFK